MAILAGHRPRVDGVGELSGAIGVAVFAVNAIGPRGCSPGERANQQNKHEQGAGPATASRITGSDRS